LYPEGDMNDLKITYDSVGKVDLAGIYNQPTPVDYFSRLSRLGYRVADEAKPAFRSLIEARRASRPAEEVKVVDVGCSYGINAALLKYDCSLSDLEAHYLDGDARSRAELLSVDARFFDSPADDNLVVIGLDNAGEALRYAVEAGILDAGIAVDLEAPGPVPAEIEAIEDADVILSTGCYGYVTDRTFERILDQCPGSRPWIANMVLRMFDYTDVEQMLERRGYVTERIPGLVPQRRFASPQEQLRVLGNLDASGIDPTGLEARGWYYAELFVSLPEEDARDSTIGDIVPALQSPMGPARAKDTGTATP
jgi:SAM-dependent methyltransferase